MARVQVEKLKLEKDNRYCSYGSYLESWRAVEYHLEANVNSFEKKIDLDPNPSSVELAV